MLIGLIGNPISVSWSEMLFNRIFEKEGKRNAYYAINASPFTINRIIDREISPFEGFNITAPYKEYILNYAEDREPLVWKTGSANVIRKYGGGYSAFNVDYLGFEKMVKETNTVMDGRRIAIIGSGGVSRTVLYYILTQSSPEYVAIVTRDTTKAEKKIKGTWQYSNMEIINNNSELEFDIIINCTPLGMKQGDHNPFPKAKIAKNGRVLDLTYQQVKTEMMKHFEEQGARVFNGRIMFFEQARETYRIFFDEYPQENIFTGAKEDVIKWLGEKSG